MGNESEHDPDEYKYGPESKYGPDGPNPRAYHHHNAAQKSGNSETGRNNNFQRASGDKSGTWLALDHLDGLIFRQKRTAWDFAK